MNQYVILASEDWYSHDIYADQEQLFGKEGTYPWIIVADNQGVVLVHDEAEAQRICDVLNSNYPQL